MKWLRKIWNGKKNKQQFDLEYLWNISADKLPEWLEVCYEGGTYVRVNGVPINEYRLREMRGPVADCILQLVNEGRKIAEEEEEKRRSEVKRRIKEAEAMAINCMTQQRETND